MVYITRMLSKEGIINEAIKPLTHTSVSGPAGCLTIKKTIVFYPVIFGAIYEKRLGGCDVTSYDATIK